MKFGRESGGLFGMFRSKEQTNSIKTPEQGNAVQSESSEVDSEKKKEDIMYEMFELGEREIVAIFKLDDLADVDGEFSRATFGKSEGMHEADQLDSSIQWLNEGEQKSRAELMSDPDSAKKLLHNLLGVTEEWTKLGKNILGISENEWDQVQGREHQAFDSKLDLGTLFNQGDKRAAARWLLEWKKETEQMERDLYAWAQSTLTLKNPEIDEFTARRFQKDIERLQGKYGTSKTVLKGIIDQRHKIRKSLFPVAKISPAEWSMYIKTR